MKQQYEQYTDANHAVWKILYERQEKNLNNKACKLYHEKLKELKPVLHGEKVPVFDELNSFLLDTTGWRIEVVKGLIPVDEFFELLAVKKFPSSTWLRKMEQLDYLEEPDMFHDIFGHIPLLADTEYADLMQYMGCVSKSKNHAPEWLEILERYYWFTIEFGLMQEKDELRIYGAGIISSFGESNAIFQNHLPVLPFDADAIMHHEFTKSEMQQEYFRANSIFQIRNELEKFVNKGA